MKKFLLLLLSPGIEPCRYHALSGVSAVCEVVEAYVAERNEALQKELDKTVAERDSEKARADSESARADKAATERDMANVCADRMADRVAELEAALAKRNTE